MEERWRKGGGKVEERREGRKRVIIMSFYLRITGLRIITVPLIRHFFVLTILRKRVHVGGVPQRQEEDQGGKVGSEEKKEKGGRQTKIETEKRQGEQNLISTVSEYSIVPN